MNLLFAMMFGAGVAGYAYTKLGRRVGYENNKEVFILTAVIFTLTTIFFYTILAYVIAPK